MISHEELDQLLQFQARPGRQVLTVYLNVDQSKPENLNRGFETVLRNQLRQLEQRTTGTAQRKTLREAASRIQSLIQDYRPAQKTLVMVLETGTGGLFWQTNLRVPVPSQVYWLERPYVRPLIEARDEFQRYAVVLTDRQRARLFTVALGEIEEEKGAFATAEVRKFDGTGKDQLRSQMKWQHQADEHHKWHQKHVAETLDKLAESHPFERLLLAGPTEAVTELKGHLSPSMRDCLIGTLAIPFQTSEHELLLKTLEFSHNFERKNEEAVLDSFMGQVGRNFQAVAGLDETVRALEQGRVRTLLYAEDFQPDREAIECERCGALASGDAAVCPHCRGRLRLANDPLGRLVEQTARQGGHVEQLCDGAGERLNREARGIGALLRF